MLPRMIVDDGEFLDNKTWVNILQRNICYFLVIFKVIFSVNKKEKQSKNKGTLNYFFLQSGRQQFATQGKKHRKDIINKSLSSQRIFVIAVGYNVVYV